MKLFLATSCLLHDQLYYFQIQYVVLQYIVPSFQNLVSRRNLSICKPKVLPNSLAQNVWSMCLENISHAMDDTQAAFVAHMLKLNQLILYIRSNAHNIPARTYWLAFWTPLWLNSPIFFKLQETTSFTRCLPWCCPSHLTCA